MTFKGDTLEAYDPIEGKRVARYDISSDGKVISTTDVATGETSISSFKFMKDEGIVVIDDIQFFHRK